MITLREIRSRGSNRIIFETMEFYHPTFQYVRLVNNQMFDKNLGGMVFNPSSFMISESQQSRTPIITSTIQFGKLGNEFKEKLKLWRGSSRIDPIKSTFRIFDSVTGSMLKSWTLFVNSVSIDQTNVSCELTLINPLNNNVALLYNPTEWTGLIHA